MLSDAMGALRNASMRKAFALSALLLLGASLSWIFAERGSWLIALLTLCFPALLALALTRPILVPYALYILVIPIDSLFTFGASGTIARFLGLLSGVFILFYAVRRGEFIVPHRVIIAIVALLAYAALSVTWSLDTQNGTTTIFTLVQLAGLYFIIAASPIEQRDLRLVLSAAVASGIVAALYGIWTFHGQTMPAQTIQYGRLTLVIGNSTMDVNMYADSLLLPIAIALWAWMRERNRLRRAALFVGLCAMFGGLIVSGSRESLLACGLMAIYIALRSAHWRRLIPPFVIGTIGAALTPQIRDRFSQALGSGGAGRLDIWKVAWHAFVARPIFGYGLGSFGNAYDLFYIHVYQAYNAGWTRASHDLFVHYGVEGGIIGIILVCAVWVLQFRQVAELRKFPEVRDLATALDGALIALFIAALFIDIFESKALWLAFALIAQVRACVIWSARSSGSALEQRT